MSKKISKSKRKEKKLCTTKTIEDLQMSRNGGQIALVGYTYQLLYSCYLILSNCNESTSFILEGVEDIDSIKQEDSENITTHIQLKYSKQRQNASFLKDILKNFLEAYLIDKNRNFKLVYDFDVAQGYMSKLFNYNLDKVSTVYWENVINNIKEENLTWNWESFSFSDFISKLSFERVTKNNLMEEIDKILMKRYTIVTDNMQLFCNGIMVYCLYKMITSSKINKKDIDQLIQRIKDDISKGSQNPAHAWIKKIDFIYSKRDTSNNEYFEGKKATPQDIARKLPIRRLEIEKQIETSIQKNKVTVVKASSGQGKTTVALQVAYNVQNEYTIYQLIWCNDVKELKHIVQFFKSRVQLGEKPLILIDNLDSQSSEWNRLAQLLQEEIIYNYKLLITTREDDWYYYSGDLSNIHSLQTVKLSLSEQDAEQIYKLLYDRGQINSTITDWHKAWDKVANKALLIEYVYLLTHGEMIADRIANQISQINRSEDGRVKCEILRDVCFADICGVRLSVKDLIKNLEEKSNYDYGELLNSIKNEFLININESEKFIEGLHPVRSQHIVDTLHQFVNLEETAINVVKMTAGKYLSILFSNLSRFILDKKSFYKDTAKIFIERNDLASCMLAVKGLFSSSAMIYYNKNKKVFDDANEHGGLFLISMELNPFLRVNEFDYELQTLNKLKDIDPANTNVQYLCNLRDNTPKIILSKTDLYLFCNALFDELNKYQMFDVTSDINSYSQVAYWLYNIDYKFDLTEKISLEQLWKQKDILSVDAITILLYTCFCANKEKYMTFINANMYSVINYLKIATQSVSVTINESKKSIHIEYISLSSNYINGNEESVSRIKTICTALPIFNLYCADKLTPKMDALSVYDIPDEAHKEMPIENIIIMFHQEFVSLWNKTIISNYECDSIFEWLKYWFFIRKEIINLFNLSYICICKLLEGKKLGEIAVEVDNTKNTLVKNLVKVHKYPNEERPFLEKAKSIQGFGSIESKYFGSINNFCNQFASFLARKTPENHILLVNLRTAKNNLIQMQNFFYQISKEQGLFIEEHKKLCSEENNTINRLMVACLYYKNNQPNKYFNKYSMQHWYETQKSLSLEQTKQSLHELSLQYFTTFPNQYFYEELLKCYPIVISDINISNTDTLFNILSLLCPIIEFDYEYVIILITDNNSDVIQNTIKISKQCLEIFKQGIEKQDSTLIEKSLSHIFPIECPEKSLECFSRRYKTQQYKSNGYEDFDRIFNLLWAFSVYHKKSSENNDEDYYRQTSNNIKSEIQSVLSTYKGKIDNQYFNEILDLCNQTFNGGIFDDIAFNEQVDKLIEKLINI